MTSAAGTTGFPVGHAKPARTASDKARDLKTLHPRTNKMNDESALEGNEKLGATAGVAGVEAATPKSAAAGQDRSHYTVVFEGDLRALGISPFAIQSTFGRAVSCGYGDSFKEVDALTEECERSMEEIAKLRDDLDNTGARWRPIETAPRGYPVLLGWANGHVNAGRATAKWFARPSHWMPLPSPPLVDSAEISAATRQPAPDLSPTSGTPSK